MLNFSQKERMLLEDEKSHEETCIKKYTKYADEAEDPSLKQMFLKHASQEREHFNTLSQLLNGQLPSMQQGQNQQNQQNPNSNSMVFSKPGTNYSQRDAELCKDLLMTETFISGTYNTTIFECKDSNVRQILNHIQKEEQQHGEEILNYMISKGMQN